MKFLHLETTGIGEYDEIVEFSIGDEQQVLAHAICRPRKRPDHGSTRFHGLTWEMLQDKPDIATYWHHFRELGGEQVVVINREFTSRILRNTIKLHHLPYSGMKKIEYLDLQELWKTNLDLPYTPAFDEIAPALEKAGVRRSLLVLERMRQSYQNLQSRVRLPNLVSESLTDEEQQFINRIFESPLLLIRYTKHGAKNPPIYKGSPLGYFKKQDLYLKAKLENDPEPVRWFNLRNIHIEGLHVVPE